jgi:hypothetical protein
MASMKMTVFWDTSMVPRSLIEVDRRFSGAYRLHYRPDGGGSTYLKRRHISTRLHRAFFHKAIIFMLVGSFNSQIALLLL